MQSTQRVSVFFLNSCHWLENLWLCGKAMEKANLIETKINTFTPFHTISHALKSTVL